MTLTLSEAIERCRQNESQAQQFIYQQFSAKMFGVCLRYAPTRADAEDWFHDGFIKVFNVIGQYRGEGSFEGWIRRIFVSIALNNLRRNRTLKVDEYDNNIEAISTDTPNLLWSIEADQIMISIERLPLNYRTILNLYSIEGYSHTEIARELNISVESSRIGLLRAKAALSKELTKAGVIEKND